MSKEFLHMRSSKSQQFWLPVTDYPRAFCSFPRRIAGSVYEIVANSPAGTAISSLVTWRHRHRWQWSSASTRIVGHKTGHSSSLESDSSMCRPIHKHPKPVEGENITLSVHHMSVKRLTKERCAEGVIARGVAPSRRLPRLVRAYAARWTTAPSADSGVRFSPPASPVVTENRFVVLQDEVQETVEFAQISPARIPSARVSPARVSAARVPSARVSPPWAEEDDLAAIWASVVDSVLLSVMGSIVGNNQTSVRRQS